MVKRNDDVGPANQHSDTNTGSSTGSVATGDIVLRTTGLISSFRGEGFPEIFRNGTPMSKAEAERAFEVAKWSDVELKEVNK